MTKPRPIDLRSDTLTQPTAAMRRAMAEAPLGDDVFGEDPTVIRLEERTAELLGKEAALYVPSGTMSNQLGVRTHCAPGDELICEIGCHIYNYEQGGASVLSGVATRTVEGDGGILHVEQLTELVRREDDHLVRTRLVCLENTHNRGGGRVLPYDTVDSICRWAHEQGLSTHLDGARLFNAQVATGISTQRWAEHFDTVSVCFSKGLGAPVGSALAGPRDLIRLARRHRKLFGGGMRQAGVIAAGALYALEHHIERLAEDHANAKKLGKAIGQIEGLELRTPGVDTNIVIFRVDSRFTDAASFAGRLREAGVLMLPMSRMEIRAVTHLDVTAAEVERAIQILAELAREPYRGDVNVRQKSSYA